MTQKGKVFPGKISAKKKKKKRQERIDFGVEWAEETLNPL